VHRSTFASDRFCSINHRMWSRCGWFTAPKVTLKHLEDFSYRLTCRHVSIKNVQCGVNLRANWSDKCGVYSILTFTLGFLKDWGSNVRSMRTGVPSPAHYGVRGRRKLPSGIQRRVQAEKFGAFWPWNMAFGVRIHLTFGEVKNCYRTTI